MWLVQISEYIDLTFHKNVDELMDQGKETLDAHTVHHIKGDVIWALGSKAKHEIMRGQWVRAERRQLARINEIFQEKVPTHNKCIPHQSPIFQREARRRRNTG